MKQENKERLEEMAMEYMETAFNGEDSESGGTEFRRGLELCKHLKEVDELEMTAENQAERIQVERERNETQEAIEERKRSRDWKDYLWDVTKMAITVGVPAAVFVIFENRTMELEEHGTVKTNARRGLGSQVPRIFTNPKI